MKCFENRPRKVFKDENKTEEIFYFVNVCYNLLGNTDAQEFCKKLTEQYDFISKYA